MKSKEDSTFGNGKPDICVRVGTSGQIPVHKVGLHRQPFAAEGMLRGPMEMKLEEFQVPPADAAPAAGRSTDLAGQSLKFGEIEDLEQVCL